MTGASPAATADSRVKWGHRCAAAERFSASVSVAASVAGVGSIVGSSRVVTAVLPPNQKRRHERRGAAAGGPGQVPRGRRSRAGSSARRPKIDLIIRLARMTGWLTNVSATYDRYDNGSRIAA